MKGRQSVMSNRKISRRDAIQWSALGAAGALAAPARAGGWPVEPEGHPFGGLKAGLTSYTTRSLSLDETIAALRRLGIRYISIKSFHLPYDSSKEERKAVRKKITGAGLEIMGCGVIGLENDEQQIRDMFQYCTDAGAPVAVVAPKRDALPAIERAIQDFPDLKVAIHNHGPEDEHFPSPTGAFEAVRSLDERIGLCVDVGHTFRLAEDPIAALQKVQSRLYDVHLKDYAETGERPPKVPLGRGVMNIRGVLEKLKELRYSYHAALEWEGEEDDPVPGMAESYGFMRGVFSRS